MITTLFLVSGWFFWFLIFLIIVAEIAATKNDKPWVASVVGVVAIVLIALFTDADPIRWIGQHWLLALIAIPLYFLVGAAWARYAKWQWLLGKSVGELDDRIVSMRKYFADRANKDQTWEQYLLREGYPPSASKNKERITTWIAFWPFSMLWEVMPWQIAVRIFNAMIHLFDRDAAAKFGARLEG